MGYLLDMARSLREKSSDPTKEPINIIPWERHWRFRLEHPDGTVQEVRTLPEATYAEAVKLWPGAVITPLPDDLSEDQCQAEQGAPR
jgi:hypothetical protein